MKKPYLKTHIWILILAAILCVCLLAIFAPRRTPGQIEEMSGRIDGTPEQIGETSGRVDGTPEQIGETSGRVDGTPKRIANIYIGGELVRRVDLNGVTEAEYYRTESHGGFNEILMEPGRICVASADCPDQICVMEGWLPDFGLPVVCLPHDLIIEMEEDSP